MKHLVIYDNKNVTTTGEVQPEKIELYVKKKRKSWYTPKGRKPKQNTKIQQYFQQGEIKRNALHKASISDDNTNNYRYFPAGTQYANILIAEVMKFDRQYVQWWYDNSYDKQSNRSMYTLALLNNEVILFDLDEE